MNVVERGNAELGPTCTWVSSTCTWVERRAGTSNVERGLGPNVERAGSHAATHNWVWDGERGQPELGLELGQPSRRSNELGTLGTGNWATYVVERARTAGNWERLGRTWSNVVNPNSTGRTPNAERRTRTSNKHAIGRTPAWSNGRTSHGTWSNVVER